MPRKAWMTLSLIFLLTTFAAAQTVPVTILHYNDFHAANLPYKRVVRGDTLLVGGAANLDGYIEHYRATETNPLLLHAGDDFQGTPVSMLTRGASQVEIMNMIHPDAYTVGNHEFDYSVDTLFERMSHATFPVLSANVVWDSTGKSIFAPDTVLTIAGVRVGIFGMMLDDFHGVTSPKMTRHVVISNRDSTIRAMLDDLEPRTDIQILLSHCGVWEDSLIAMTFGGEIDLIVGGHSHSTLWEPKVVNGCPIVQAGSRGGFLGIVHLEVDTTANRVASFDGHLERVVLGTFPEDSALAAVVNQQEKEVSGQMDVVLATLKSDMTRGHGGEGSLGNWITDAYRDFAGMDISIANTGGIRKDMFAGPMTLRDILEISPFGNELVTFQLTGVDLQKIIEHQAATGGRDNVVIFSGLSYKTKDGKLVSLRVNGKKIKLKKTYTVVAPDFVTDHAMDYFGLDSAAIEVEKTGYLDRDALVAYAKKYPEIVNKIEGRIIRE
ncbi:MAG: bifunctional UDP-sugar hydrolase/5'-nucleotidase [bacterium]